MTIRGTLAELRGLAVGRGPKCCGMTSTEVAIIRHADGIYEQGGLLWRAKPGATSTFEERAWVAAFYIELHLDRFWNPWRMEEETAELERAHAVMNEWERAEPGFTLITDEELEAKFARQDRDWDQWREEYAKRVDANEQRYDPEREQARLELLEVQSWLRHEVAGIAKLRSGEAYPKMDPQRRAQQIAELDERIGRHQAVVERLSPIVGDPEDVVDEHGLLPSDRRPTMLYYYREWRVQKVQRLRAEIAEVDAGMATAEDKAERSRLGIQRQIRKCQLDEWLAVPRMRAEDMCADCLTPTAYHEQGGPFTGGPCSAWPENAKKLREVREMLRHAARSNAPSPQLGRSKPQRLAVVPSGLPIAEVVNQLQKLQKQYPDAEVRRGRANRWELWPKEGQNRPAKE